MNYSIDDIVKSYKWLNYSQYGLTELIAFHPKYKPGDFEYNRKNGFLPKIWYAKSVKQVIAFVKKYHKNHTCCYGINPRPSVLKAKNNFLRSAKDSDIKTVLSFYLDFDFAHSDADKKDFNMLKELIKEIEFYLGKEKIRKPVWAYTGNGYHLLFALPPIKTEEHPDIGEKIKAFRDNINYEFSGAMESEGIKLDSTVDLRRVAKIYGTKKPYKNARLSRFYGNKRIEDVVLKEYILSLDTTQSLEKEISFNIPDRLPEKFENLLNTDTYIKKLWNNEGKTEIKDVSRTGYDFSLVKECIRRGITDINDLSAILALRPEGAYQKSSKNGDYIRRTIGNALYK